MRSPARDAEEAIVLLAEGVCCRRCRCQGDLNISMLSRGSCSGTSVLSCAKTTGIESLIQVSWRANGPRSTFKAFIFEILSEEILVGSDWLSGLFKITMVCVEP